MHGHLRGPRREMVAAEPTGARETASLRHRSYEDTENITRKGVICHRHSMSDLYIDRCIVAAHAFARELYYM